MPPKGAANPKRRARVRPKIALACNSCREKKIRCDGIKPICGPCVRRSYRNDQCVYNTENSRSTSRDQYVLALHQRIKDLEDICVKAGASVQNSSTTQRGLLGDSIGQDGMPPDEPGFSPNSRHSLLENTEQNQTPVSFRTELAPEHTLPRTQSGPGDSRTGATEEDAPEIYESPLFDEGEGHITGMGQIILSGADSESRPGNTRYQFYGSSSTASLMRLAWQTMPSRPGGGSHTETTGNRLQDTFTNYGFDDFALPPRAFADHLVKRFFEKIYTLYPFFHRPAFEVAYRNLWRAEDDPNREAHTDLRVGLGSCVECGPKSIVFQCALNVIFALGCRFADVAPEEAESVANTFFLRAKLFLALDFLDNNTLGVVQTLLITALYLQSSPYPSRCWHSVGIACRVAVALALHKSDIRATLTPLEFEIRRRTWQGCVLMDITLSMTYGRPSMTSHLAPFPAPDGLNTNQLQGVAKEPSLMVFYYEAIKLYGILDMILADVYKAWGGRSCQDQQQTSTITNLGTLDTILKVERDLMVFKNNVPSFLKWSSEGPAMPSCHDSNIAVAQQINVLHARYIHLQLLLYRPIFTQLYSTRGSSCGQEMQNTLYSTMFEKCATACVMAAIDLTQLVRKTYQTNAADAWWYNGFYVSTAAIVLLMSISTPSMMDQSTMDRARDAWKEATAILESMATFCRSATNTLQFLQAAYHQAVPSDLVQAGAETDASRNPRNMSQSDDPYDHIHNDTTDFPVFDWEAFADNTAPGLDDLGFLTRFNFNDSL